MTAAVRAARFYFEVSQSDPRARAYASALAREAHEIRNPAAVFAQLQYKYLDV